MYSLFLTVCNSLLNLKLQTLSNKPLDENTILLQITSLLRYLDGKYWWQSLIWYRLKAGANNYDKIKMDCSNINRHLCCMKIIDSCSCGFIKENEFHFLLVCYLHKRPRITLQYVLGHIAPFTLRTLLYGEDNLDLTVNKRIITETLRVINNSKRFARLPDPNLLKLMSVCWLCVYHSC